MEDKESIMKKWNHLADLGRKYNVSEIEQISNAYESSTDLALEKSKLYEALQAFDVLIVWLATQQNTGMVNDKLSKGDKDLNPFDELLHQHFEEALVKLPKSKKQYLYRKDTVGCDTEINDVLKWWGSNQGKIVETPWFLAVSDKIWDEHPVNWEIELSNSTNAHYVAKLSSAPALEDESIFLKGSKFEVLSVIEPKKGELLVKLKEVDIGTVPDSILYSNTYYPVSKGNRGEIDYDEEPGFFD